MRSSRVVADLLGACTVEPPCTTCRPVVAYLKDDAVEIVDDDDMREAYNHGFYGKGTVSRRQPNRAMVVPPDLLQSWLEASASKGVKKNVGADERIYEQDRLAPAASPPSGGDAKVVPPSHSNGSAVDAMAGSAPTAPLEQQRYMDTLTILSNDFEEHIMSSGIPDAFTCAAAIASHGHSEVLFETARQVAHYVSCPPPRLRHVRPVAKQQQQQQQTQQQQRPSTATAASSSAAGADSSDATLHVSSGGDVDAPMDSPQAQPSAACSSCVMAELPSPSPTEAEVPATAAAAPSSAQAGAPHYQPRASAPPIRYEHLVFETSIIEPEAAVYMLARSGGRFAVLPSPDRRDDGDHDAASRGPMSLEHLWLHFCARIANFPARAAVYARCRDLGYVVRDGHAFGSDFVIYPDGPGRGHATACIIVMPLRMIPNRANTGGEAAGSGHATSDADASPVAVSDASGQTGAVPVVLPPGNDRVMSSWLHAHGHGRVIGTVKKQFVLAYATVRAPSAHASEVACGGADANAASVSMHPPPVARMLSNPAVALGELQPSAAALAAGSGSAADHSSVKPAAITVRLQNLKRWMLTGEHKSKNEVVMSRVAAAEAMAEAAHIQATLAMATAGEDDVDGEEEDDEGNDSGDDGSGQADAGAAGAAGKRQHHAHVSAASAAASSSAAPKPPAPSVEQPKPLNKHQKQQLMRATLAAQASKSSSAADSKAPSLSGVRVVVHALEWSMGTDGAADDAAAAAAACATIRREKAAMEVERTAAGSSIAASASTRAGDPAPLDANDDAAAATASASVVEATVAALHASSLGAASATAVADTFRPQHSGGGWYADRQQWAKVAFR